MELKDVLSKRQSIRHFMDADVPDEALREILDAARRAPSGKNLQNWHFIVIRDAVLKRKVADAITLKNEEIAARMDAAGTAPDKDPSAPAAGDRFRKFAKHFTLFFLDAPVLIVVMTENYYPSGYHELAAAGASPDELLELRMRANPGMQSLGAAIENLTLRTFDLGYGCCWLTSANYAAVAIEDLMRTEAGFDREGWYLGALLTLGVPAPGAKSPDKKPLADICTML